MITIFRAKRIDSDKYVKGYYICNEYENKHYIFISDFFDLFKTQCDHTCVNLEDFIQVCPLTLAISFPDMLDSQGNKIFASLGKNGKGGDILFDMEYEYTLSFGGLKFNLQGLFSQPSFNEFDSWEEFDIIGIEE